MGTSSGGYHTNGAIIGGLAGGGAAAAGGIYFLVHHHGLYTGCIGQDGNTLTAKNGKKFQLQGESLKPGERVALKAKESSDNTSGTTLEVQNINKDYGACEQTAKR